MSCSWSPRWTPFKGCWRSAAAVAHNLIFVEVDGECQFVVGSSQQDLMTSSRGGAIQWGPWTLWLPKEPHLADVFLTCLKGGYVSPDYRCWIQRGHKLTLTLFNLHGASLVAWILFYWERIWPASQQTVGFPRQLRQYRICLQCRRPGFGPWVGKIPWKRQWQPTPVVFPGKSHGQRSLVGYSPWGHKRAKHDWATNKASNQSQQKVTICLLAGHQPTKWTLACLLPPALPLLIEFPNWLTGTGIKGAHKIRK